MGLISPIHTEPPMLLDKTFGVPSQITLNHSSDGIFVVDFEPKTLTLPESFTWRFVSTNAAYVRLWLLPNADLRGLNLHEVLPETIAASTLSHLQVCWQQRQGVTYQAEFQATDRTLLILTRLFPGLDSQGNVTHVTGICQDISALPQGVERLRLPGSGNTDSRPSPNSGNLEADDRLSSEANFYYPEEKYRSIFENAVEGIFQTTPDGYYLTANPMLAQIYGYDSPAELMASLTDIQHQLYVDPARRNEFRRLMQEQGAVWRFESQIYRKDGSIIWISESARAVRDVSDRVILYEGTVEEITDRKLAEVELHKRESLLQGVARATGYLLTDEDYQVAIAKALATLGNAAGVDRVYIYENHPHAPTGEVAMSMRYEWVRPGISPSIHQDHWQNQPYSVIRCEGLLVSYHQQSKKFCNEMRFCLFCWCRSRSTISFGGTSVLMIVTQSTVGQPVKSPFWSQWQPALAVPSNDNKPKPPFAIRHSTIC
jgi:PAS domain S-box-containing protein